MSRAERDRDEARAVGEPLAHPRSGRSRGAQQEMTARPRAGGPRVDHKGRHPIQPVAEQQRPLRQLGQQPLRQGPFRFAVAANRRGQRIVQPDLQQHGRPQLGERGPAAARPRFLPPRRDLRRVGQAELSAIEGDQPPAAPKRLALPPGRPGPQHPTHQLRKDLPRQAGPTVGPRTVGQRVVEHVREMLRQRARVLHHVKDQRRQQLAQRHPRFAPAPPAQRRDAARTHELLPGTKKPRRLAGRTGMCRHSQRKYRIGGNSTREISPL